MAFHVLCLVLSQACFCSILSFNNMFLHATANVNQDFKKKPPSPTPQIIIMNKKCSEVQPTLILCCFVGSSRLRGLELDREKVHVHNEMRLSKRRNSNPVTTPLLSRPATKSTPISRPSTRDVPGRPSDRRRGEDLKRYLRNDNNQTVPSKVA